MIIFIWNITLLIMHIAHIARKSSLNVIYRYILWEIFQIYDTCEHRLFIIARAYCFRSFCHQNVYEYMHCKSVKWSRLLYIYIYIYISVCVCVMQTWFLHPMYVKIYREACYDFSYTQHIQPVMSKVQSVHSTICNVSKTNFLDLKSRKTAMMYLDFLGYPLSVPSSSKVRYSYIYGTGSMSELPALTLPPNVWATATKNYIHFQPLYE